MNCLHHTNPAEQGGCHWPRRLSVIMTKEARRDFLAARGKIPLGDDVIPSLSRLTLVHRLLT
jgi:hypothetical protein